MKYLRILCVGLCLMVVGTVNAQEVGEVMDSVKSSLKAGSVKEAVGKIQDSFKAKKASADKLLGSWKYVRPAVYATKGNLLVKLVGNTTASSFEKLLGEYIEKSKITPQNTTMTFHKNGTFERSIAGRKKHGVWMVNGEKLMLAINNVQTADITTHMEGDSLMILIDADKIIEGMMMLGTMKDNKSNKALKKVAKVMPGLQGGFLVVKKQ